MNIIKKPIAFVISFTFLTTLLFAQKTVVNISDTNVKKHISYLASDSLRGRFPGDMGGIKSSKYIQEQLSGFNLEPLCENGLQKFNVVTTCTAGTGNLLIVNSDTLKLAVDYNPVTFGENTQANADVVFAGYGFDIELDSLNWNSYINVDVKGKWVLLLTEDPEPDNMMSEFIPYANKRAKVTLAKDKGAAGVLLVNGFKTSKKDKPLDLAFDQNVSTAGIPVLSITRKVANKILGDSKTIEEFEKLIIKTQEPKSLSLSSKVIAHTDVIQNNVEANNVVFQITAGKPSEKYIVIGAHFDHLGMGGESVSSRMPDTIAVHNGADDNASGVAGIIELAGFLSKKSNELNHNIIVVAFDAEEMGTLGSKYFVNNPPVPIENMVAMVNFDMIGRMKHDTIGITIGGTGTALEFDSILNQGDNKFKLNFSTDGYGPSDHAPFYSSGMPVLFITTGAHSDYHTPFDDIEKLDIEKLVEILEYSADVILSIDSTSEGLSFQSTGAGQSGSRRTRLKVTLGIIPDVAGVIKNGLGIDGVRTGGPADKGGIVKGDKITAINGEQVTNIYDYMFRLSKLKPESTAIVEIERSGKKEVLLIQL